MARPVEYDRAEVLEKAAEVFWLKGYQSASMAALLEATALTSRSLYNLFGSKKGLFEAALETYYGAGVAPGLAKLETGVGGTAIRDYFGDMTGAEPLNGCLFVNTLAEKNSVPPRCLARVQGFFEQLESVFRSKLRYAAKHEGFLGEPTVGARQLVAFVQGLAVYSKMNSDLKARRRMAFAFLENLGI